MINEGTQSTTEFTHFYKQNVVLSAFLESSMLDIFYFVYRYSRTLGMETQLDEAFKADKASE